MLSTRVLAARLLLHSTLLALLLHRPSGCHGFLQRMSSRVSSAATERAWHDVGTVVTTTTTRRSTHLHNDNTRSRLYEIPLLDVLSLDNNNTDTNGQVLPVLHQYDFIQPLPSRHLPEELQTVYAMQLTIPLHQSILQHALDNTRGQIFGHLAAYPSRPSSSSSSASSPVYIDPKEQSPPLSRSLIGAIGCTVKVLLSAPISGETVFPYERDGPAPKNIATTTTSAVCLGLDRFIVREVVQTVPYVLALVENLFDDDSLEETTESTVTTAGQSNDKEDDEEGDDDDVKTWDYATLTSTELMHRTLRAMDASIDLQRDMIIAPKRTLLEESIIGVYDNDDDDDRQIAMDAIAAVEETAAIWIVFQQALVDVFCTPRERLYAVAIMATSLLSLNNDIRRAVLVETNPITRLQRVCAAAERSVAWTRARRMADSITDASDDASKDLTVGAPQLPPWASSIGIGTRLEYYWNEAYGWCQGTVVKDPERIVDEWILTVYFNDDTSTHRLPLTADEKARWRPL